MHLPDIDGDAVIARLQAEPETAALPIVILSGGLRALMPAHRLIPQIVGFMAKPIEIADLLALLASFDAPS